MHRLTITLAVMFAITSHAAVPKTGVLAIPSNTTAAVTSVAIGDVYNYQREVDSVKLTLTGHHDTNTVLVATVGQPFGAVTNTMATQSFDTNGVAVLFPRNVLFTNGVERFFTDKVSVSCAFVTATNSAVTATLTNAASVSISIIAK